VRGQLGAERIRGRLRGVGLAQFQLHHLRSKHGDDGSFDAIGGDSLKTEFGHLVVGPAPHCKPDRYLVVGERIKYYQDVSSSSEGVDQILSCKPEV
jgi:hypothetical protein